MNHDDDDDDDAAHPLDDEDRAAIAALTVSDIAEIDAAILSHVRTHWQKTAAVVVRAMYAYPDKFDDIPDVFYGQRVMSLAADGLIEASGSLRRMRFSEIRAQCHLD